MRKFALHRELRLMLTICVWLASALLLQAQDADPFGIKPKNHDRNKALAESRYTAALKTYEGQPDILVLPGLIADRAKRRVEVSVERSAIEPNAPCEFMVVSEQSDHTYETLLISFAKPSDAQRALEFLGVKAGESFDPNALRYWPKGESFVLRLFRKDKPPLPIESLLLDRRTGKALPEDRFIFTGARRLVLREGATPVYAADAVQPMSIVSLFNTADSVFQVPRRAAKSAVYQNTVIHPDIALEDEGLFTLVIEPVNPPTENRVKNLALEVSATKEATGEHLSETDLLKALQLRLKDSGAVSDETLSVPMFLERLSHLDRQRHDFFLSVYFSADMDLSHGRAMAGVLALIDSDQGVRVEPPPAEQLYYRAFIPDRDLLDRETRIVHPLELIISEQNGKVTGKLAFVTPVRKPGSARSELEVREAPVTESAELRRQIDAENRRMQESDQGSRPSILMVFAPSAMAYGKLTQFLAPVLSTYRTIYLYLDEPATSLPLKKREP